MSGDDYEVMFTREEIAERVDVLATEIMAALGGRIDLFLCVLKGAMFFCADLMRAMSCGAKLDFIQASSYKDKTVSSGVVEFLKEPQEDMNGKTVVIIEDIIDSGLTLEKIRDYVLARGAAKVVVVAFLDKKSARKNNMQADFVGFEIEPKFVVGYGLDFAEDHRDIPEIRILKQAA
jgi:hypoxanthine phosphoribosyltransferase